MVETPGSKSEEVIEVASNAGAPSLGLGGTAARHRSWGDRHPIIASYWYWWLFGAASLVAGSLLLSETNHSALGLAVVLLGALTTGQWLLDMTWAGIASGGTVNYTQAFQQGVTALIAIPGVILGLLAVFGKPPFPLALQVGAFALVLSLVITILVLFFTAMGVPNEKAPLVFLGFLTNVIFWSLALGLLTIASVLLHGIAGRGG